MRIGLPLTLCVLVATSARAQVTTPPPPPPTKPDTAASQIPIPVRDSIKSPIAVPEMPALAERPYTWDRAAILASGEYSLEGLLSRIPGAVRFTSGYHYTPGVVGYAGNPGGVRLFIDGVERDELNPHAGGVADLSTVALWQLEEVRVERGASELRVYARTLAERHTSPFTRTDVYTGDEGTNQFRGLFGKRFGHGQTLQLGAEQGSSSSQRGSGGGDRLTLMARVGWASGPWSVDAFLSRAGMTRELQSTDDGNASIPRFEGKEQLGYIRLGYGIPDSGSWVQGIASQLRFEETTAIPVMTDEQGDTIVPDRRERGTQFVVAAGTTVGPLHVSATGRIRMRDDTTTHDLSVRAAVERVHYGASLFAEEAHRDSTRRLEGMGFLAPFSGIRILGAVSQHSGILGRDPTFDVRSSRVELELTRGRGLVSGGLMWRDHVTAAAPVIFDSAFTPASGTVLTGLFATVHAPVWKAISLDAVGSRWNRGDAYLPQTVATTSLSLRTLWLSRFPTGNFGFLFSVEHEYRSETTFPLEAGGFATSPGGGTGIFSTLLEIRIVRATLTWQYRNVRLQPYDLVPGYLMPRGVNFYGVRWEFRN